MATVYVRAANPIWWLPDHTGVSLNDEYYAFFLTNTLPYIPQAVYSTPNGTPYSNPIEFSAAGTLPDNLYFDPTLTYRIEIRHGNTQADELIWEINDFVPGSGGGSTVIDDELTVAANVITNPQFADISFQSPFTFTQITPATYTLDVGPGWQLILTGAGTTTLTQTANAGSSGIAGNPSYYLDISNSGWTSAVLRQRLENNGALFGGGAVAVAFTAASVGNAETLTVSYAPSTGSATNIFQQSIPTGTLTAYKNAINLPASTNSDTGTAAYVDILFTMDGTSHFQITNIQITGQSSNLSSGFDNPTDAPAFQELSYPEVVNGEFNVYRNPLVLQAKGNMLTGWTFAQNPYQFWPYTITAVAANQYTLDQTIVVQQKYVDSASGNNVSVGHADVAQDFSLAVQSVTNTSQFALIQYIDSYSMYSYWGQIVSALVRAYFVTSNGTSLGIKARLIYRTTLPSTISQTEPIASWTPGGDPVFAAGWTAIAPENDPSYTLNSVSQGYSFNRFQLPVLATDTMVLGIVIYSTGNMNSAGTPDGFVFDRISLINNDFAMDAAPETYGETLIKCQYYYETSYPFGFGPGTTGGTTTTVGMNSVSALVYQDFTSGSVGNDFLFARSFYLRYKQTKRTNPDVVFYSPFDGAANQVYAGIWRNNTNPAASAGNNPRNYASSNFDGSTNNSKDGIFLLATSNAGNAGANAILEVLQATGTLPGDEGIIQYHYTLDSRLGVN